MKSSILRTLMVLLRGQNAEIREINGAIFKGRKRYIRVLKLLLLGAKNKKPHASLLESIQLK